MTTQQQAKAGRGRPPLKKGEHKVRISIQMQPDTWREIDRLQQRTNRSMSAEAVSLIESALLAQSDNLDLAVATIHSALLRLHGTQLAESTTNLLTELLTPQPETHRHGNTDTE